MSAGFRENDSLIPKLFLSLIMDRLINEVKVARKGYKMEQSDFKAIMLCR